MLPCAYRLTEKKNAIFIRIFTALKNAAEQNYYVLNLKNIVTDFELAAMNPYKFHWPDAELFFLFYSVDTPISIS